MWHDGMMGAWMWGSAILGLLFSLALLAALILLIVLLVRKLQADRGPAGSGSASGASDAADEARAIARRRYASGEISREEFEALRRDLS